MAESDPIERIAQLATLQFTLDEIADVTDVTVAKLGNPKTPEGAAVKRGRFEAEVAVRSALLKSAREGTPKALDSFGYLTKQRKRADKDR